MTKVKFHLTSGETREVEALAGLTLMEVAVQEGVEGIDGDCGGSCNCGTCHVHVADAWLALLPAPEHVELAMLEGLIDSRKNSRLCCQIKVAPQLDGLELAVPRRD